MATTYPTTLDSYALISAGDTVSEAHPTDRGDAIEAIEARVGVTNSDVTTSHDYLLEHLPSQAQNWDAGAVEVRAETFESDVATGTAPLTVASTTVVANLNASAVGGAALSSLVQTTGNQSIGGVKTYTTAPVFPANTVKTADIQDSAVTTAKINADAVDGTKIADDAIDSEHITDGSVDTVHLASPTGSDTNVVTGTKGTSGNLAMWNADGDAVDSTVSAADLAKIAFGALELKSSGTEYQAATDGFVYLTDPSTSDASGLIGTVSGSLATVVKSKGDDTGFTMPVAKDEYWRVNTTGSAETVRWRSIS